MGLISSCRSFRLQKMQHLILETSYWERAGALLHLAFIEAGFGFAEQVNGLLGCHEPLQHDLTNRAASRIADIGVDRSHLDHNHGVFDAVEPELFVVLQNAQVRLLNVGFASPACFVPQATQFPNTTDTPPLREKKVLHRIGSVHQSKTSSPLCLSRCFLWQRTEFAGGEFQRLQTLTSIKLAFAEHIELLCWANIRFSSVGAVFLLGFLVALAQSYRNPGMLLDLGHDLLGAIDHRRRQTC